MSRFFKKRAIEIAGLSEDFFSDGDAENIEEIPKNDREDPANYQTRVYLLDIRGKKYVLKQIVGPHLKNTLRSIDEKRSGLEEIGYPQVHSINHEHQFYLMEYLPGKSVYDSVLGKAFGTATDESQNAAAKGLLEVATKVHGMNWLLNDLNWHNFVFVGDDARPIDPDRVSTVDEEAEYIANLGEEDAIFSTPQYLSLSQCHKKPPTPNDEMQGIAQMIDFLYNGNSLIYQYLERREIEYARNWHASMLIGNFYPDERSALLPKALKEPIEQILKGGDLNIRARDLLEVIQ